jgi:hypothetical protein
MKSFLVPFSKSNFVLSGLALGPRQSGRIQDHAWVV